MALNELDKEELINLLKEVISEAVEQHPLSDEEVQWVRMAIEAEAKRAAFRKAVIEKTFIGLMSSALIAICMYGFEFFKNHWK
jgi:hypothetical protein